MAALNTSSIPAKAAEAMPAAKSRCYLNAFAGAKNLASIPIDWQTAYTGSASELSDQYIQLLETNRVTSELRAKFGDGANTEFVIFPYDPDIEAGHRLPMNGLQAQAVHLKRILKEVFPQSLVRAYRQGESLNEKPSLRRPIFMKVKDSAEKGDEVDWKSAGDGPLGPIVEMSLLKVTNPGPNVLSKSELRKAFNIPESSRVLSIYASVGTSPSDVQAAIEAATKSTDFDVIIPSSRYWFELRERLEGLSEADLVRSSRVSLIRLKKKTIIINETRGKLPEIYTASDAVLVLGSPNVVEPINAGLPTIVFRKAEWSFNQRVWSAQTALVESTGGGYVVDSMDEALVALRGLGLKTPTRKVYEIPNTDGTTPIVRLLTNISNAIGCQATFLNCQR